MAPFVSNKRHLDSLTCVIEFRLNNPFFCINLFLIYLTYNLRDFTHHVTFKALVYEAFTYPVKCILTLCESLHFQAKMNQVKDVAIKPLEKSIYLKPMTMHFTQNGNKRTWDLLEVHDSVAIILHNIQRDTLIFVKQFRPPVYFGSIPEEDRKDVIDVEKYSPDLGITLEMCAGLVDKNMPLEQIAKEEILEECGFDVPLSSLVKIGSYRSGVGTLGSLQTTYYCAVTDDMKVSQGGGVGDEIIEVVEMTLPEVKKYLQQDKIPSPPSFLFAVYWFLVNKAK